MASETMSSAEFVEAALEDHGMALVPMRIAMKRLKASRAWVLKMVEQNKLDAITVQDGDEAPLRGITVKSLKRYENQLATKIVERTALALRVRKMLIAKLKKDGEPLTYGELMDPLGLNVRNIAERKQIYAVLDQVSTESHEKFGVLLSALVINQQQGRPGPGFFEVVARHRADFRIKSDKRKLSKLNPTRASLDLNKAAELRAWKEELAKLRERWPVSQ